MALRSTALVREDQSRVGIPFPSRFEQKNKRIWDRDHALFAVLGSEAEIQFFFNFECPDREVDVTPRRIGGFLLPHPGTQEKLNEFTFLRIGGRHQALKL